MTTKGYLYCIRVGSEDCFKIGHSTSPDLRIQNLSTGSNQRLTTERLIPSTDAKATENYVHALLAAKRRDVGEFFDISLQEFDAAVKFAGTQLTLREPIIQAARTLRRKKPTGKMHPPSSEELKLCRELKIARAEAYLLAQEIDTLEARIQLSIGDNDGLEGIASWKWVEQQRFRLDLFREKHPRLFRRYTGPIAGRVFKLVNARASAKTPSTGS